MRNCWDVIKNLLIVFILFVHSCSIPLNVLEVGEVESAEGAENSNDFCWVDTDGARNVLRRATQLATILWTPLCDVPCNNGFFDANTQVVGIPYSSTKQINKYLGLDVSLHTFMTAVHNPYSVLYTENIGLPPYNGGNCACYYGTVCSTAVSYALGIDYLLTAKGFATTPEFKNVEFNTLEDLKECDVLQRSGHVFMIYKMDKDDSGAVTKVTIFEAAGRTAHLTEYSSSDFLYRIESEHMQPLRYSNLDGVKDYSPSPYVIVGSEPIQSVTFNSSLCPNRGDKSVYRTDEAVIIDVLDNKYDTIVLKKNGSIYRKIAINGIINDLGYLEQGQYEIYLQNATTLSDCVWITVMEPIVTVKRVNDKVRITFECALAEPSYCLVTTEIGGNKYTHVLSEQEKKQGFVDLEMSVKDSYYYKVVFSSPFGTIINKPIRLSI